MHIKNKLLGKIDLSQMNMLNLWHHLLRPLSLILYFKNSNSAMYQKHKGLVVQNL